MVLIFDFSSVRSFESGNSSLRRRKRMDSQTSVISAASKQSIKREEQEGKLIETEKSQTGGVSIGVLRTLFSHAFY